MLSGTGRLCPWPPAHCQIVAIPNVVLCKDLKGVKIAILMLREQNFIIHMLLDISSPSDWKPCGTLTINCSL